MEDLPDFVRAGPAARPRVRPETLFDPQDPNIKRDIVRMVMQWLEDEGYHRALVTLHDEAAVRSAEADQRGSLAHSLRSFTLAGDWANVEALCTRQSFRNYKSLLYAVYRQQYLELIVGQESQKAFSLLCKRLKPLEPFAKSPEDFRTLCYLVTCKSVQDGFPAWESTSKAREELAELFLSAVDYGECAGDRGAPDSWAVAQHLLASGGAVGAGSSARGGGSSSGLTVGAWGGGDTGGNGGTVPPARRMPDGRLVTLLLQSYAYQVEFSHFHPSMHAGTATAPAVRSLMEDYSCPRVPNSHHATLAGHAADVKAVAFLGHGGTHLASGSSDTFVRLWDCRTPCRLAATLAGHTARVWSVAAAPSGGLLASAGGEGVVRIWRVTADDVAGASASGEGGRTAVGAGGAGGADCIGCRTGSGSPRSPHSRGPAPGTWTDLGGGARIGCAHTIVSDPDGAAIYAVALNESAHAVAAGGYDRRVRVFDMGADGGTRALSTLTGHESAVTTVCFNPAGNLVISGSKDCRVRFWDVRSGLCVKTLASPYIDEVSCVVLAASARCFLVCSRDNANRLWDMRAARPVVTFKGHTNTAANFVRAGFGPDEGTVVGGSEDGCVHIWSTATGARLHRLRGHVGAVYDVAWSDRASQLASCGHDGTVRLWMWDADVGYEGLCAEAE